MKSYSLQGAAAALAVFSHVAMGTPAQAASHDESKKPTVTASSHQSHPAKPKDGTAASTAPQAAVQHDGVPSPQALQDAAHTWPGLPAEIVSAYVAHNWKPYWLTGHPDQHDRLQNLLSAFDHAQEHGLTLPPLKGSATEDKAAYELSLSWAAAFMARALSYGALSSPSTDAERETAPPLGVTLEKITKAPAPGTAILARAPQTPLYRAMLKGLAESRQIAARQEWPKVPSAGKLSPGDDAAEVALLRQRLAASNAYHTDDETMASTLYDEPLVAAVKVFQDAHGLEPDGVVGSGTRQALNVSPAERVDQLKVNLDRLRWLPSPLSDRYLMVNIAGFEAWLFHNDAIELSTPVIVGKDQQQTPSFSNTIRSVEFNPSWEVPRSIAVREILPKLAKDHAYLTKENMEVYEGWENGGQLINPASVDWASLAKNERLPYRFRQKPGPKNSLGRVKLLFPNSYDVYLHDTPSRGLFNRRVRAFSHGCMRVGKPLELAAAVLGMSLEDVNGTVESGKQIRRKVTAPLPIHITYLTSWADPKTAALRYGSDVYDRDAALITQLHPPGKSSLEDPDPGIAKARAAIAALPSPAPVTEAKSEEHPQAPATEEKTEEQPQVPATEAKDPASPEDQGAKALAPQEQAAATEPTTETAVATRDDHMPLKP